MKMLRLVDVYKLDQCYPAPFSGTPSPHIFAPGSFPANQDSQIPGTGVLGTWKQKKREMTEGLKGLGWGILD